MVRTDAGATVARREGASLATRLSLFLWNSVPDGQLLNDAADGRLDTKAGVKEVVAEMLASPKGIRGPRHFFREWLGYDLTPRASKAERFDAFTPETAKAMVAESDHLLQDFIEGDQPVMDIFAVEILAGRRPNPRPIRRRRKQQRPI